MNRYRLVLLGSGAVGKSSLVERFLNDLYTQAYIPTVDELYRETVRLPDGGARSVEILDTAGLHQFPAMRHISIQSGRAFLIVYAVDNWTSFKDALSLVDLIKDIKGTDQIAMILVGNKCDLTDARQVTQEKAQKEASLRNCAYTETSAKCNLNIQELFLQLLVTMFEVAQDAANKTRKTKKRKISRALQIVFKKQIYRANNNTNLSGKCAMM